MPGFCPTLVPQFHVDDSGHRSARHARTRYARLAGYGGINLPFKKPSISPRHTHFDGGILHIEAKKNQFNRPASEDSLEVPVALFWNVAERLVLRTPLRRTMLTAPPTSIDEQAFEELLHALDEANGGEFDYDAAPPKHAFFRYLLEHRPVLLHGTGDESIGRFEPRRQTDYDNEWTEGVFATDDPIWPIFFAVVNRPIARSLVNGCSRRRGDSHYYFSIGVDPQRADAWRSGWIYVLPRETFRLHPSGPEWLSPVAVTPLARMRVDPGDFPFLGEVTEHRVGEPVGRIVVRATLGRTLRR